MNLAQILPETIQVLTPAALGLIVWRLRELEKKADKVEKLLLEHLIPKHKED